jgi:hypothetical protein
MRIYSNDAWSSSSYTIKDEFGDINLSPVFALENMPQKEPITRQKLQDIKRLQRRVKKMGTLQFFRP